MKLILLIVIALLATVQVDGQAKKSLKALFNKHIDLIKNNIYLTNITDFENFKNFFKKGYKNDDFEVGAVFNYLKNKKFFDDFNKQAKNNAFTFTVGEWEYSDLNQTQIKRRLAGFKSRPKKKYQYLNEFPSKVPASLNYTAKGWVAPVLNQGLCACCWAFSTVGVFEGQHAKNTGQLAAFSPQNLIDCSVDPVEGNWGCDGGNMYIAYEFLLNKQKGLSLLRDYKFTGFDNGTCAYKPDTALGTLVDYVEVATGNETLLMQALAAVGPLSVAVDSSSLTFQSYKKGVYNDPKCLTQVDHAVLLVGYGTDTAGGDFWLVKNSWGTSWGERGYIRLARNRKNMCGITDDISYPLLG